MNELKIIKVVTARTEKELALIVNEMLDNNWDRKGTHRYSPRRDKWVQEMVMEG